MFFDNVHIPCSLATHCYRCSPLCHNGCRHQLAAYRFERPTALHVLSYFLPSFRVPSSSTTHCHSGSPLCHNCCRHRLAAYRIASTVICCCFFQELSYVLVVNQQLTVRAAYRIDTIVVATIQRLTTLPALPYKPCLH